MESFIQNLGGKAFHGRNLLKWIHKHGLTDFDAMTDLSKNLRAALREKASVLVPEVVYEQPSRDGTHKWVLELSCNNRVESVFIPDGDRVHVAAMRATLGGDAYNEVWSEGRSLSDSEAVEYALRSDDVD